MVQQEIDNKKSQTMICDLFPSISNELLHNTLKFASKYMAIRDKEGHTIKHTKKTK